MRELFLWSIKGPWIAKTKTDTQWKWEKRDDILYIALQGSVSKLDWLYNFMFWKKPYKNMEKIWFGHSGFVKKWKSIEEDVREVIGLTMPVKIVCLGFSQGAGILHFLHEWLWFNCPAIKFESHAFGSPRAISIFGGVGERFRTFYRYEVRKDLITKLPPGWMLYRHVGELIWKKKNKYPFWKVKENHMSYRELLE